MEFNLTLNALVNAAGGFLFFVAGVVILIVAHGTARGRAVAAFATTFGLTYIVGNLLAAERASDAASVLLVCAAAATVAQTWLAHHLSAGLPRRRLNVIGLALVAVFGFSVMLGWLRPDLLPGMSDDPIRNVAGAMLQAQQMGLIALLAAVAVRASKVRDEGAAMCGLALAVGPITLFFWTGPASQGVGAGYLYFGTPNLWMVALSMAATVLAVIAALPLLNAVRSRRGGVSRFAFPVLMVAALAGIVLRIVMPPGSQNDFGLYGIIRTIGLAFLALAVTKHDLLQVPLHRIAVRNGALATGALASLFIVAQVAQNFFAAQYGLLMGGIVAGAVLFAAQPIQRALEARPGKGSSNTAGGSQNVPRAVQTYRDLAHRLAADGRLSAADRRTLAYVGQQMGLGAGFVHDVIEQAEVGARTSRKRAGGRDRE